MKKVNNRKIEDTIRNAKNMYRQTQNSLLKERIDRLLSLRNIYRTSRKKYSVVNRELNKNIQSVADFVFKSLQEIEIEVLRCGGRTVYIPQTIPKSAERLAAFLNSLSGMILRMKMSMSLDKINQILSQFNQMTNDILQKNEKLKILRKEYLEISKVLESEIEATEQFLNPGNHILVNVRERFD